MGGWGEGWRGRDGVGGVRSLWPKFILPTFLPARARGSMVMAVMGVFGGDECVVLLRRRGHWENLDGLG